MSELRITVPMGGGRRVELTFAQMIEAKRLMDEFTDPIWHVNECGCCVSVHERDDSSRGYVIGRDGESDWVEREHA